MSLLEKIRFLLLISRPAFWPLIIVGYTIGILSSGGSFGLYELFNLFFLTFPFCFFMFAINDVYDLETDFDNPRKKNPLWGATLNKADVSFVKGFSFLMAFAVFLYSLLSNNIVHIGTTLFCLVAMYLYSSPPFRIKSIPVLDSLFNCLFGFGPFAIGYSLFGGIGFLNTAFIFFSFTFSAAHAIFAVVDLDEDKKANVNTFATVFGPRIPILFALAVLALNIPFTLLVLKSASVVLILYCLLLCFLFLFPSSNNARFVCNCMMLIVLLWMVFVPIAWIYGIESPNLYWIINPKPFPSFP